jgi:hypothetical protein
VISSERSEVLLGTSRSQFSSKEGHLGGTGVVEGHVNSVKVCGTLEMFVLTLSKGFNFLLFTYGRFNLSFYCWLRNANGVFVKEDFRVNLFCLFSSRRVHREIRKI